MRAVFEEGAFSFFLLFSPFPRFRIAAGTLPFISFFFFFHDFRDEDEFFGFFPSFLALEDMRGKETSVRSTDFTSVSPPFFFFSIVADAAASFPFFYKDSEASSSSLPFSFIHDCGWLFLARGPST